jgi:hypothetical protein
MPLAAGSDAISSTLPSTSIFQPWYRQRSPPSSLRPIDQRGAAVRAGFVEHADATIAVPEYHEVLAERARLGGRAIGLADFLDKAHRRPVAAHQLAHGRVTLDAAQQLILFSSQHSNSS